MEELLLDKEVVFGMLSGQTTTAINRRLYRDFRTAEMNLTPEQFTILLSLFYKDGITQQELAQSTFKDKTGITRLLDNLQKQDLVQRKVDEQDKRINKIFLTALGVDQIQRARQIALQTMQLALTGLSEEEIRAGEAVLKKIFKNLE